MKYLKAFNNHNDYLAYIVGSEFKDLKYDSVSYCIQQNNVHFDKYIPRILPQLLDILYSDANGNLSFTSEVLPASEGKTPIGLCIAGSNFFGENEPARWISLKYMNYTTPETGSLTSQGIYWGNYGTDINTIDNIQFNDINNYINDSNNEGYFTADWITGTDNKIPVLFTENNEWNISVLGAVNQYAVTDIDGKNKTDKILITATAQSTWQTDTSINNEGGVNYAPAACCCARYHTLGTQGGDWYLGAAGEMSIIVVKRNEINTKLAAINTIYQNDCMQSLIEEYYWTSTENTSKETYFVSTYDGRITSRSKYTSNNVLAMIQY